MNFIKNVFSHFFLFFIKKVLFTYKQRGDRKKVTKKYFFFNTSHSCHSYVYCNIRMVVDMELLAMFRFSLLEQGWTSKRGDCPIKFFLLRLEMLEWVAETKLLVAANEMNFNVIQNKKIECKTKSEAENSSKNSYQSLIRMKSNKNVSQKFLFCFGLFPTVWAQSFSDFLTIFLLGIRIRTHNLWL